MKWLAFKRNYNGHDSGVFPTLTTSAENLNEPNATYKTGTN